MNKTILILIIILICGFVGGIGNYFLLGTEVQIKSIYVFSFLKCIVLGIIAAGLVPLFLNIISSNLLEENGSATNNKNYFIFASFCLLVSLFSNKFLFGMYSNFLETKIKEEVKNQVKIENDTLSKRIDTNYIIAKAAEVKSDFAVLKSEGTKGSIIIPDLLETSVKFNLNANQKNIYQQILKNKFTFIGSGSSFNFDSNVIEQLKYKGVINEVKIFDKEYLMPSLKISNEE